MSKTARSLIALRLAEEQACAGYLTARKAMLRLAAHLASMTQMVRERPTRVDYRAALNDVLNSYRAASNRTRLAYSRWQRAQLRADAYWTVNAGAVAA
ncbi:hypothetical protein [Umezawaea sp. Da 62-37]|uniref:hypothetical protein n=1 Tax=Umezawaea sp. Da 62-37 TaxID=3075927 RepID=UPI0028F70AF8|nr:hypothetical protein [Umezawaea sp. Da 62-37]WNV83232.1 hypothetical protein RM788_34310 [Umezawaea sp. Da 62-37]